jgi:hypothetical protein
MRERSPLATGVSRSAARCSLSAKVGFSSCTGFLFYGAFQLLMMVIGLADEMEVQKSHDFDVTNSGT